MTELAHKGLAHPAQWTKDGNPTHWTITPQGHALLGRLMRENGLEAACNGAADWEPPPSRGGITREDGERQDGELSPRRESPRLTWGTE